MFHKVKSVKVINKFLLEVVFQNDIVKVYDVSNLFEKWKVFQNLKNIDGLFEQVKVDHGGYGISWNEEIDLECEELWEHGIEKNKKERKE